MPVPPPSAHRPDWPPAVVGLGSPIWAAHSAWTGPLAAARGAILAAVDAAGAALLPATALRTPEELDAALRALGVAPQPYTEGQSPRTRLFGQIYTSTEYPPAAAIPLHHELSYRAHPPALLAFLCARAPGSGGETPLLDGARFVEDGPPEVIDAFRGRALTYRKRMHGGFGLGKSWQDHFETADRDVVEAALRADGADFQWTGQGGLVVEQRRPALQPHPRSGALCWRHQATLWHPSHLGPAGLRLRAALGSDALPTDVRWEDGAPIDDALIEAARAAEWAQARARPWAAGDLLLVDNLRVAHGRAPFTGPRSVLVGMGGWPA
jgi:alpha-ketoglutarate-dependent taurine dioxygenase